MVSYKLSPNDDIPQDKKIISPYRTCCNSEVGWPRLKREEKDKHEKGQAGFPPTYSNSPIRAQPSWFWKLVTGGAPFNILFDLCLPSWPVEPFEYFSHCFVTPQVSSQSVVVCMHNVSLQDLVGGYYWFPTVVQPQPFIFSYSRVFLQPVFMLVLF